MIKELDNQNAYIVSREDVALWAKAEKKLFKQVEEHIKKLEKSQEKFQILWLQNKDIVVKTKTSRKDFFYIEQD